MQLTSFFDFMKVQKNEVKNNINVGVEKEQGKCNERIRKDKFFEEQTLLN